MNNNIYKKDHDYYVDDDPSSRNGGIQIYSLVYIICILLVITLGILCCYYSTNRKNKDIIKIILKNRGKIKKFNTIHPILPEMCTICYNNYEPSDLLFTFYCNHTYHHECVKNLFENNGLEAKCPYCKQNITIDFKDI